MELVNLLHLVYRLLKVFKEILDNRISRLNSKLVKKMQKSQEKITNQYLQIRITKQKINQQQVNQNKVFLLKDQLEYHKL